MNFPNLASTFLISQPKLGEDLILANFPNLASTFLIWTSTFLILAEKQLGSRIPGSHFFPTIGIFWDVWWSFLRSNICVNGHLDPPANGQAVIHFLNIQFLATVSDNSVRYQSIKSFVVLVYLMKYLKVKYLCWDIWWSLPGNEDKLWGSWRKLS